MSTLRVDLASHVNRFFEQAARVLLNHSPKAGRLNSTRVMKSEGQAKSCCQSPASSARTVQSSQISR